MAWPVPRRRIKRTDFAIKTGGLGSAKADKAAKAAKAAKSTHRTKRGRSAIQDGYPSVAGTKAATKDGLAPKATRHLMA